jgi:2'-5' RNA ligase
MTRAFLGIGLPERVTDALTSCRRVIIDTDPSWAREKWVPPENLHVTLRFLGTLEPGTLDAVAERLRGALSDQRTYTLGLSGCVPVPNARASSMLWASAGEGAGDTASLAGHIDVALKDLVGPAESRRFKTHVTLCRARRARPIDPVAIQAATAVLDAAGEAAAMSVRSVTLYTSTLTPAGPHYETHTVLPLSR